MLSFIATRRLFLLPSAPHGDQAKDDQDSADDLSDKRFLVKEEPAAEHRDERDDVLIYGCR